MQEAAILDITDRACGLFTAAEVGSRILCVVRNATMHMQIYFLPKHLYLGLQFLAVRFEFKDAYLLVKSNVPSL